jgi:hypothetical protein
MRTAARYKVDASKITAKVKVELSKKRKGGKVQCHNSQIGQVCRRLFPRMWLTGP